MPREGGREGEGEREGGREGGREGERERITIHDLFKQESMKPTH